MRDSDASEGFLSSEDEPSCNYFQTNKENIHTTNYEDGGYDIFIYKGAYFVGKIMSVNTEGVLIKSMKKSLKIWKWPEKEDLNLYQWSDIKGKIKTEKPQKNLIPRGNFFVPEMIKYSELID